MRQQGIPRKGVGALWVGRLLGSKISLDTHR